MCNFVVDMIYACDYEWLQEYGQKASYIDVKVTQNYRAALDYNWAYVESKNGPGLGFGDVINTNKNSGAQAINVAVMCGAKRIALLGFDMRLVGKQRHFFGDYSGSMNKASNYNSWIQRFKDIKKDAKRYGVEIINCTKDSELKCFRYEPIKTVFESVAQKTA